MPEYVINSGGWRGLGEGPGGAGISLTAASGAPANTDILRTIFTTPTDSELIDICSGWLGYASDFSCWNYSPSIWQQAATQRPSFNVAAPGAPANLTTLPDTSGAAAQALADEAIRQTQANAAAQIGGVPDYSSLIDQCALYSADWPFPFNGITCPQMVFYGGVTAIALLLLLRR